MCGHQNKLGRILFLSLFLLPCNGEARAINFATGFPFVLGFHAGASKRPATDFASGKQSYNSYVSHFYSVTPSFDFTTFVVRGKASLWYFPITSGSGTFKSQAFTETSDPFLFSYGADLLLVLALSSDLTQRFYLIGGLEYGKATIRNQRSYASVQYLEKVTATQEIFNTGMGYEFMLVQNFSMAIETGYRFSRFNKFSYTTPNDVNGTKVTQGSMAIDEKGTAKALDASRFYFDVALNLNF